MIRFLALCSIVLLGCRALPAAPATEAPPDPSAQALAEALLLPERFQYCDDLIEFEVLGRVEVEQAGELMPELRHASTLMTFARLRVTERYFGDREPGSELLLLERPKADWPSAEGLVPGARYVTKLDGPATAMIFASDETLAAIAEASGGLDPLEHHGVVLRVDDGLVRVDEGASDWCWSEEEAVQGLEASHADVGRAVRQVLSERQPRYRLSVGSTMTESGWEAVLQPGEDLEVQGVGLLGPQGEVTALPVEGALRAAIAEAALALAQGAASRTFFGPQYPDEAMFHLNVQIDGRRRIYRFFRPREGLPQAPPEAALVDRLLKQLAATGLEDLDVYGLDWIELWRAQSSEL